MKNLNKYYTSYNGNENRIDYLKYGLLNEYGYSPDNKEPNYYNENNIIKTNCNHQHK